MAVLVDSIEVVSLRLKYCGGCGKDRPTSEFYRNTRQKDGLQTQCKVCIKKKKPRAPVRNAHRQDRKAKLVQRAGGLCHDCHAVFPDCVFDFHHLDPKTKRFAVSGSQLERRWSELVKEADKCILLCANCHRIRHSR